MRTYFIPLILSPLLITTSSAIAASFDCKKAGSVVEKSICSDRELSDLDSELGRTYRTVLAGTANSASLVAEQKSWLASRNQCPDLGCLKSAYQDRLTALRGTGQPSGEQRANEQPPGTDTITTNIARLRCEQLQQEIVKELNQPHGAPFGKPYLDWEGADFIRLKAKVKQCADSVRAQGNSREREAIALERGVGSIIDRYQSLQESARAASDGKKAQAERDAQRAKSAQEQAQQREAADRLRRQEQDARQEAKKRQDEADKEAARATAQTLRTRAAASYETHRAALERQGLSPRFLDSTLILPLFTGGMKGVIGVGPWLSLVMDNPNAEFLSTREWDAPRAKGVELRFKFPQRPSFGLLFKHEGSDTFLTHTVMDDNATPIRGIDMTDIFGILGTLAGSNFQDFAQLYMYPGATAATSIQSPR
ncbi:hypothetical protein [Azospirillum endophyticum]